MMEAAWAASQHSEIVLLCSRLPGVPSSHVLSLALGASSPLFCSSLCNSCLATTPRLQLSLRNLRAADQLYRAGKFAEAEASYQALLKTDSKLVPAQCWQAGSGNAAAAED